MKNCFLFFSSKEKVVRQKTLNLDVWTVERLYRPKSPFFSDFPYKVSSVALRSIFLFEVLSLESSTHSWEYTRSPKVNEKCFYFILMEGKGPSSKNPKFWRLKGWKSLPTKRCIFFGFSSQTILSCTQINFFVWSFFSGIFNTFMGIHSVSKSQRKMFLFHFDGRKRSFVAKP